MKQLCKLVALLAVAGGLLALTARFFRRRKQQAADNYITLYRSED